MPAHLVSRRLCAVLHALHQPHRTASVLLGKVIETQEVTPQARRVVAFGIDSQLQQDFLQRGSGRSPISPHDECVCIGWLEHCGGRAAVEELAVYGQHHITDLQPRLPGVGCNRVISVELETEASGFGPPHFNGDFIHHDAVRSSHRQRSSGQERGAPWH